MLQELHADGQKEPLSLRGYRGFGGISQPSRRGSPELPGHNVPLPGRSQPFIHLVLIRQVGSGVGAGVTSGHPNANVSVRDALMLTVSEQRPHTSAQAVPRSGKVS